VVIPVGLDGLQGRLVMKAAHRDDDATLHWHLDGRYLGPTHRHHEVEVAPEPGPHEVVVVDAGGAQVARRFEVLPGR
jgi:penicillin-binding protein 1C